VKSARIVVSAATTKATRLQAAEKALIGLKVDDAMLKKVADTAADEADVLADVRGSASYKRELLRVYVVRAVRAAMQANGVPH
jgi:carbon-monoxide dehydrogenase medium subunit